MDANAGRIEPVRGRMRPVTSIGAVRGGSGDAEPLAESVLRDLPGVAVLVFDRTLRVLHTGGDPRLREEWIPEARVGEKVVDALALGPDGATELRAALTGKSGAFQTSSADGGRTFAVTVSPVRSADGAVIAGTASATTAGASRHEIPEVVTAPRYGAAGHSGIVARRALMLRLSEAATARVLVVTAPAGYGKTTVVAQWERTNDRPFAWVSLEPRHDDAGALSAAIGAALDVAGVDGGTGADGPASEAAAGIRRPCVLVLDDAHHLRTDAALEVVAGVIDAIPQDSQVVIASRRELPLRLGRLTAKRDLVRLTARNLAFSAAEGAALLEAAGLDIDSADTERLVRRTEGWPAALALLALRLAEPGCSLAEVAAAGARDRAIAGYLREEVLAPLSADTRRFLLAISPLERFSGPLCDVLLDTAGSGEILQRLEGENVPIVSLDTHGEWYRLNDLLRDELAGDLARRDPAAVNAIHLRASAWWAEHGDIARAIEHAHLAADMGRVSELVARMLPGAVLAVGCGTLECVLSRFGDDEVRRAPVLALARAWAAVDTGPTEACHYWAAVAEAALASAPATDTAVPVGLTLLRAVLADDGVAAMGADAVRTVALEPPGNQWTPLDCYLEGVAAELVGDRQHAVRCLDAGERLASIGAPAMRARILAQLALIALDEDDGERGRSLAEHADAIITEHGLGGRPDLAIIDAIGALTLAKGGHEIGARERAARVVETLGRPGVVPAWSRAQTRLVLAHARLCLGEGPAARTLERQASQAVQDGAADATKLAEDLESLRETLDAFPATSIPGAGHLTAAELRVLRYLPTHLSFREIGDRLFLSRHTVKTEAISTYRKLGVNSRTGAVEQARKLGIL
jgi:LuxR family transcriptional regulator, maltose regulon positive regulatory protein